MRGPRTVSFRSSRRLSGGGADSSVSFNWGGGGGGGAGANKKFFLKLNKN